jgi:hypothetical protein
MHGILTLCCVSRSEVFAKNVSAFAENVSVYFLGGHGDSHDFSSSFTALCASNLLAQFSRQIVIQIICLESPKVCGNLAVRPLYCNCYIDIAIRVDELGPLFWEVIDTEQTVHKPKLKLIYRYTWTMLIESPPISKKLSPNFGLSVQPRV